MAARTVADTGLAGIIVPRTPRQHGTAREIDLAYAEINALGGAPEDPLLSRILDILERHGAVDPDLAPAAAARSEAA